MFLIDKEQLIDYMQGRYGAAVAEQYSSVIRAEKDAKKVLDEQSPRALELILEGLTDLAANSLDTDCDCADMSDDEEMLLRGLEEYLEEQKEERS